jgi:GNAT superfamily N-acetyltransferase
MNFTYQTKQAAFRGYLEQVSSWNEDEQRRLHQRRFGEHDFRIIQLSGVDVGILAISRQPDCINLHQMFILPEYQSKGIGDAVLTLIIEDAAAKIPVRLRVLKVNPRALTFYQRLGFKQIGETETHILMEKPAE